MKATRTATIASPGSSATHAVKLVKLTRTDRAVLKSMATRHRVNNLAYFLEGILAAEDQKANPDSVAQFSIYEQ
ncbi:MAG TPA: hypothetical protein VN857_06655 [Chthoniobacterales bacterium]|jgi:hypothetical protein|nr:hypothetical protein [Chthoniobacterales bacterium]